MPIELWHKFAALRDTVHHNKTGHVTVHVPAGRTIDLLSPDGLDEVEVAAHAWDSTDRHNTVGVLSPAAVQLREREAPVRRRKALGCKASLVTGVLKRSEPEGLRGVSHAH